MKSASLAALLCAGCLFTSPVSAAEPAPVDAAASASTGAPEAAAPDGVIGSADGPTAILVTDAAPQDDPAAPSAPVAEAAGSAADAIAEEEAPAVRSHPVEIQFEYIEHRFYKNRHIDNYTVHLYQEMKRNGTVSFWRGLTFTRPTGYLTEDDGSHRDSDSWGIGPSFMIRWEKPVSEKWSVGIDGTGSLLAYNHAFPAGGRAFGFLWRVGPRVSYYPDKDSAIRLGWSYMHCSNGFSSHNPGYNGVGFSLMYAHNF